MWLICKSIGLTMKLIVILFCLLSITGFAQTDSVSNALPSKSIVKKPMKPKYLIIDTTKINIQDTLLKPILDTAKLIVKDSLGVVKKDTSIYKLFQDFPILNNEKSVTMITAFRKINSSDYVFYLLIGIVFLMALIQALFPKYIRNVFNIFFQTNFRQLQTKEQLTQDNIASLLLNILFIVSASTFVTLIAIRFNIATVPFWKLFLIAIIVLASIYLIKLLFTQFMGWVFNREEAAKSYTFIVFIVNKIMGIVLIPFLFMLAFSYNGLKEIAFSMSAMVIVFLLFFRFFSTYKSLSNRLKINAIHFFLYFCSVEVLPLLIMYKALSNYISNGI